MASPAPTAGATPERPKPTTIELIGGIHCNICMWKFADKKEYDQHYLSNHSTKKEEIIYTCVVCYTSFNNYPSFRGHCYSKHVMKNRFKCHQCNKLLSKLTAFEAHNKLVHSFKCKFEGCNIQLSTKKDLNLHQVIHKVEANKPPYPCQVCGDEIDTIVTCEDHIDKHCTFTYNCPICNDIITKEQASQHLTKHFGKKVLNDEDEDSDDCLKETDVPEDSSINIIGGILCCFCDKLFENRVEIEAHFGEDHSNEKILYSCNICGKQYEKYNLFGNHCYYHYSRNKFECSVCPSSFPRLSLLVRHAEAHADGRRRHQCSQCDRQFASERRRFEHEREVHDIRGLQCPEPHCQQQFNTPKDLVFHRKMHKSDIDTWCRCCGLQFPTLSIAEKHLEVHKKKLFHCPACNKQYREKYLLMKHIPQHFETIFHMCKTCGKAFNAKGRLIEHTKTHLQEKPLGCKFCGKRFHKPYQLSQHLNIHTGAQPYECAACPRKFASQPNCVKHMRRMHNLKMKMTVNSEPKNSGTGSEPVNLQEAKKTTEMAYSDDSTMDSVSIDSSLLEEELRRYEAEVKSMSVAEINSVLPQSSDEFVSEILFGHPQGLDTSPAMPSEAAMPREFGPDFGDDNMMPHINPQLLSQKQSMTLLDLTDFHLDDFPDIPLEKIDVPKWEPPIISEVYTCYSGLEQVSQPFH